MKLWLIKLGKVVSALQEEGLVRGGKRSLKSFFALFRKVSSGDILFITGGLGDSALYRSWHIAEELRSNGFVSAVAVQDNPFLSRYADRFSVFVFHRVLYTKNIARLIKRIKERKKEIIFETDDLVFDGKYFQHMDYFRKMNYFERKQYEGGIGAEILADPYVKVCTASTSFLASRLEERGKKVFVVHNKLSKEDVSILNDLYDRKKRAPRTDGKIVIGYFSGAKGHDKDFATVASALKDILERFPQAELFLAGPLTLGDALSLYEKRIRRIPYVPRNEHFANVARMDINLAPLEIGNPFCESKSELKWFEAGILAVPTVAAATKTFKEAIIDGVDGYVAATTEEWVAKLSRLIEDAMLRKQMGEKAREKVLERYTTLSGKSEEYYNYLRSKIV
ncbi:MAG: glycosyltransferase [bacterium]|nr:glycosyltransferase [bacterium]